MMSFRTILLTLDAAQDDTELERAVAICTALDAHLQILLSGVAPLPPASPYGVVSNDLWVNEIAAKQQVIEERKAEISKKLETLGCSYSIEARYIERGSLSGLSARFARYSDLTLVPPEISESQTLTRQLIDGALFDSGRPVLLLPTGETSFPDVKRVLVAWDASLEASNAVRDAIPVMQSAERVDAVLVDPVPSFDGHGSDPGADLSRYLQRHGIEVNIHKLPGQGVECAELLLRTAREFDSDLLVMGGFGHSRLRQMIFGGTTTTLLKNCEITVLMSH